MQNEVPNFLELFSQLKKDIITIASVEGINHFKKSFEDGGFTDTHFEAWLTRKNDSDPSRAILVKSSILRDSIDSTNYANKVEFYSDVIYAGIHNEGGIIKVPVTDRMKRYFWFMYKQTNKDFFKSMALTKKSHLNITIPQRKFLGHSEVLMQKIDSVFKQELQSRLNNLNS